MAQQLTTAAMLATLAVLTTCGPAAAQQAMSSPLLEATAEATVSVQPNQAQIDVAVVTRSEEWEKAAQANAAQVKTVLDKLRGAVTDSARVETAGYTLRADYRYGQQSTRAARFSARRYFASSGVIWSVPCIAGRRDVHVWRASPVAAEDHRLH